MGEAKVDNYLASPPPAAASGKGAAYVATVYLVMLVDQSAFHSVIFWNSDIVDTSKLSLK